jgi:dual oxidase
MYGPLRFSRSDLVALTIQRGRDFGIPTYSEVRQALDLPAIMTFGEINPELNRSNPQVANRSTTDPSVTV